MIWIEDSALVSALVPKWSAWVLLERLYVRAWSRCAYDRVKRAHVRGELRLFYDAERHWCQDRKVVMLNRRRRF